MVAGDITATRGKLSDYPCAVFDGADDYVEIPHNANQLGANLSNGFTISAWINPRSVGEASAHIFDKSTGLYGNDGFDFTLFGTGGKVGFIMNAGTQRNSADNSVPYGVWKHVLVTVSSAQLANFYVNGVLSGTANQDLVQGIANITTTNAIRIGNRATATDRTFDGGIRKVKMWNKVLSATEIALDYAGKRVADGLILDVPLENDYLDKSLTGLTGTNSGTFLTNTITNKAKGDANSLNLAAATDKIVAIPGRVSPIIIGANRAAA